MKSFFTTAIVIILFVAVAVMFNRCSDPSSYNYSGRSHFDNACFYAEDRMIPGQLYTSYYDPEKTFIANTFDWFSDAEPEPTTKKEFAALVATYKKEMSGLFDDVKQRRLKLIDSYASLVEKRMKWD
jgi:hypothetical protein